MGRSGIIVTGLVGIVLVVGGIIAFGKKKDNNPTTDNSTTASVSQASPSSASSSTASQPVAAATITYTSSGFSPGTVTVNSGDTIAIKNNSSVALQFNSDPHPLHTGDPELNVGEIGPGQTGTLKVTTKGTHGYHNHLDPSQTGTIVVQ